MMLVRSQIEFLIKFRVLPLEEWLQVVFKTLLQWQVFCCPRGLSLFWKWTVGCCLSSWKLLSAGVTVGWSDLFLKLPFFCQQMQLELTSEAVVFWYRLQVWTFKTFLGVGEKYKSATFRKVSDVSQIRTFCQLRETSADEAMSACRQLLSCPNTFFQTLGTACCPMSPQKRVPQEPQINKPVSIHQIVSFLFRKRSSRHWHIHENCQFKIVVCRGHGTVDQINWKSHLLKHEDIRMSLQTKIPASVL